MKCEESSDYKSKYTCQNICSHNKKGHAIWQSISLQNCFNNARWCQCNQIACKGSVKKHAYKILVIVKANAVCNPGAMMVHFQNTLVALAAVMTSIRLAFKASLTHSNTTFIFSFYRLKEYSITYSLSLINSWVPCRGLLNILPKQTSSLSQISVFSLQSWIFHVFLYFLIYHLSAK